MPVCYTDKLHDKRKPTLQDASRGSQAWRGGSQCILPAAVGVSGDLAVTSIEAGSELSYLSVKRRRKKKKKTRKIKGGKKRKRVKRERGHRRGKEGKVK